MSGAEAWVKLLYTYGPFAILVFFVFVTERKTRAAKNEAPRDEKSKMMLLYLLNWVVIFGLVVFSLYAWWRINLAEEAEIKGHIANLTGKEVASTRRPASLFLNRDYLGVGRADYLWRLVAPKRFKEGDKVTIVFDPGLGESFVTDNELTIKSSFYDSEVGMSYNREANKLYVQDGNKVVELPQSHNLISSAPDPEPTWSLFGTTVYAQAGFNGQAYSASLESPDPVIRRQARADLAKQGGNAIPWINDVLSNSETSYRVKLGVIVALNNMSYVGQGTLSPTALTTVQSAAFNKDDALRNEANSFLDKYKIPFPVTVYEHVRLGGRSQGFIPGVYRADYRQLGKLPNDSASSLKVEKGYTVRLCDSEGNGKGSGRCEVYRAGTWDLKSSAVGLSDRVSFIEVKAALDPRQQQRAR